MYSARSLARWDKNHRVAEMRPYASLSPSAMREDRELPAANVSVQHSETGRFQCDAIVGIVSQELVPMVARNFRSVASSWAWLTRESPFAKPYARQKLSPSKKEK